MLTFKCTRSGFNFLVKILSKPSERSPPIPLATRLYPFGNWNFLHKGPLNRCQKILGWVAYFESGPRSRREEGNEQQPHVETTHPND